MPAPWINRVTSPRIGALIRLCEKAENFQIATDECETTRRKAYAIALSADMQTTCFMVFVLRRERKNFEKI